MENGCLGKCLGRSSYEGRGFQGPSKPGYISSSKQLVINKWCWFCGHAKCKKAGRIMTACTEIPESCPGKWCAAGSNSLHGAPELSVSEAVKVKPESQKLWKFWDVVKVRNVGNSPRKAVDTKAWSQAWRQATCPLYPHNRLEEVGLSKPTGAPKMPSQTPDTRHKATGLWVFWSCLSLLCPAPQFLPFRTEMFTQCLCTLGVTFFF